ncbi:MAG: hypothetical protein JJW00_02425 [Sulfurimonas sp.]|nr:hypothetical protein [Sulfurimonas sp.]
MKKLSMNLKNSWQDDTELKIRNKRVHIEHLVNKKKIEDASLTNRLKRFIRKVF